MRITPSVEMALAMACALVMAVALVWYVLTEFPAIAPEKPTWKGEAVVNVTAAVPSIGPFEREFHVNNQDPFLPFSLRAKVAAIQDRIPDSPHNPNARLPDTPTPPPPPAAPPVIHWPAAAMHQPGPTCVGLITTSQGSLLLGHMPNSEEIVAMTVGDAIPKDPTAGPQWTLLGVDSDGLARFRDPNGGEVSFPIGAPPSDPPPGSDETKPPPKTPGPGRLPANFSGGALQLPPNWQSHIPPGMQKEVQQQIMQQIMQMQAQQAQQGGSGK